MLPSSLERTSETMTTLFSEVGFGLLTTEDRIMVSYRILHDSYTTQCRSAWLLVCLDKIIR